MIVAGVRWLADALAHPTTGINAMLGDVPRDAGDQAPPLVTLFNEIDDPWVVRRGTPPDGVWLDSAGNPSTVVQVLLHPDPNGFRAHALPEYEQGDPTIVPLVLLLLRRRVSRKDVPLSLAEMARDLRQTTRTAMRAIAKQFDSSLTTHTRMGCEISLAKQPFVLNSQFAEVADDLLVDTLVVPLRIRDTWALDVT
jgi:hypothetical protein